MTSVSLETLPLSFGKGTHSLENPSTCSSSFFLNQGVGELVSVFLAAKSQAGRFLNSYPEVNHILREKWQCETLLFQHDILIYDIWCYSFVSFGDSISVNSIQTLLISSRLTAEAQSQDLNT